MEAEQIVPVNSIQQPEQNGFTNIFTAVRKGTEEQIRREFLKKTLTDTGTEAREGGPEDNTNQATGSLTHRKKLLKALEKKDAGEVWNLIAEGKEEDVKRLENLNKVCQSVADYERLKEAGLIKFLASKCGEKIQKRGCCSQCLERTASDAVPTTADEQPANSSNEHQQTGFQNEDVEQEPIKIISSQCLEETAGDGERIAEDEQETNSSIDKQQQTVFENIDEQEWITILSDPLYIGLGWLWRTNPNSETTCTCSNSTDEGVQKESNLEDVIEAALRNAHLLEKIALYEHHYSRDEYTRKAEKYEKFAADVVEESTNLKQLHTIMDVEGTGCLLNSKPDDFNQSLSLLKIAADKKRKKFVTSPKCQRILNEIIYYEWPHWQNRKMLTKLAWSFLQLAFVLVSIAFYIPMRLARKFPCCNKDPRRWWKFRKIYEHPYCKFVNHNMWYLIFLVFIFLTTFAQAFGSEITGVLSWQDYVVLSFVLGLLWQELFQEARRQGVFVYFSKWWNRIDMVIVITFLIAYTVWFCSWGIFGKWKPRENAFIVADVLYASATVMAYFHLTHIFQVDSDLGPLQLSLYKMLKDVRRFLFIFLLLYFSFATGVVRLYSFYVSSQNELRKQNVTDYEPSPSYAKHTNSLIALFWLLLGLVEEDKISVNDPAFQITSFFGRLFLMAYVVCMVIVALNMLVAMMNNSFQRIMENEDIEWKFSRTRMWLEWIDKGNTIPAPLNIVYHILYFPVVKLVRFLKEERLCCNQQANMQQTNRKANSTKAEWKKKRVETMKDLVVKYLENRYLGNDVEENNMNDDTNQNRAQADCKGTGKQNKIDLLRKELSELNEKVNRIIIELEGSAQ